MTGQLQPDVEAVVVAALAADDAVAALVGDRVGTDTPDTTRAGWVRVQLLDQAQSEQSQFDWLTRCLVQFDCYAGAGEGGSVEANLLARTVRAALVNVPTTSHSGGVVSGAQVGGMIGTTDGDLEPARDRYTITATLWVHP